MAYPSAQAKEAERVAEHRARVAARWFACAADAEAAIAEDEGRGQGRRGRKPRPWRYHALHYRVEAVSVPTKRPRRGRPPKAEAPQVELRYRLSVRPETVVPLESVHGWTVLATTVGPEACTDAELLQAYQEQYLTVEPGFRWIKHPAAISPMWLEKPERIATLAMLTVVGLLVYAVIQRQVRLYLRAHDQHVPGNKGPTATPTAAVMFALFTTVMLVHFAVDNIPSLQARVSRTIIGSSVMLWGLTRHGSRERLQGKIHHHGPHPLERGSYPSSVTLGQNPGSYSSWRLSSSSLAAKKRG